MSCDNSHDRRSPNNKLELPRTEILRVIPLKVKLFSENVELVISPLNPSSHKISPGSIFLFCFFFFLFFVGWGFRGGGRPGRTCLQMQISQVFSRKLQIDLQFWENRKWFANCEKMPSIWDFVKISRDLSKFYKRHVWYGSTLPKTSRMVSGTSKNPSQREKLTISFLFTIIIHHNSFEYNKIMPVICWIFFLLSYVAVRIVSDFAMVICSLSIYMTIMC